MKLAKVYVFIVSALFLFTQCKKSNKEMISEIVKTTKNYSSLHYKAIEKTYASNQPDTTTTPYEVWAVRDKNDTLRNGYVWVDNNYRPYNMIYDAGSFYLAIPPKKTTVLYVGFDEDFISPIDWIDVFLQPDKYHKKFNDNIANTIISDTIYRGESCIKITILYPNDKSWKLKANTFILSDKTNLPLFAKSEVRKETFSSTSELYFSDYEIDNVDLGELRSKQKKVLADNPVEREGSDSETSRLERMLLIGEQAPLFDGNYYGSGESFSLEDFIGKDIIIVDFWYTHCPPCVRAMPALSELYNQHKDKGLKIFGLNSVDNQPRSLDNLDKFLSKRQLSYDVIMIEPSVDIRYKIKGYPTMYVVDKTGKISFVEIGYDAEKFEMLKAHIVQLLNMQ